MVLTQRRGELTELSWSGPWRREKCEVPCNCDTHLQLIDITCKLRSLHHKANAHLLGSMGWLCVLNKTHSPYNTERKSDL